MSKYICSVFTARESPQARGRPYRLENPKLCVTSCPEADIEAVYQPPFTFSSVSIHDESGPMADIETYVKSTVYSTRTEKCDVQRGPLYSAFAVAPVLVAGAHT